MTKCVRPIGAFRWARWPYQSSYAQRLDRVQRKMIGHLVHVKPGPGETAEEFHNRRQLICTKLATATGRWSKDWAKSIGSWQQHMVRAHDSGAWSQPLLGWHDESWLQSQRVAHNRGQSLQATGTRALQGGPPTRWPKGSNLAASSVSAP